MNVSGRLLAITTVSGLYIGTAALGTWVAVQEGMAGRPFGWDLGMAPLPSFVFGLGTALSAPLVLLIALVAANVMLHRERGHAHVGLVALAVLAAGFLVGMLAEPITWRLLRTGSGFGLTTGVVIANIVLPVILIVLAMAGRKYGENTVRDERPMRP